MADFPNYAGILIDGFSEKHKSQLTRSDMEGGIPKQAKTASVGMVERNVIIFLRTRTDYNNFIHWYKTTLNGGASWFAWTDPISQTNKQARFVAMDLESIPNNGLQAFRIKATLETVG